MHDESLIQRELPEAELAAMAELDGRITDALERPPVVGIPEGFAARVAAQVPVRRVVTLPAGGYSYKAMWGYRAMWAGVAVLFAAMLAMALRRVSGPVWSTSVEWVMCAELVGLIVWLSLRRRAIE